MSLLVVGTLAYDTVETPSGRVEDALGGAATYFACAASFFTPVRLVGVVGEDFRSEDRAFLESRRMDLRGLTVAEGRSFRWSGRYEGDLNVAETVDTQLNVLEDYRPEIPEPFRDSRFVFLANSPPALQAHVLDQVESGAFAVMDTMNLWIDNTWDELLAVLRRVDLLVVNDQEARSITKERHLVAAGRRLLDFGPRVVIVKKGEHGAFACADGFFYSVPAFPVEEVIDPTGAGDSFAGGVMGHLAQVGSTEAEHLKRAMIYGSVVASFCIEGFSLDRFKEIERSDLDRRYRELLGYTGTP
jgi:sugar/nucleoside kinase (ribokinase family)